MARTKDPSAATRKSWLTRARAAISGGVVQSGADFARPPDPNAWRSSKGVSFDPSATDANGNPMDTEKAFSTVGPNGKRVYDPKRVEEVHQPIIRKYTENVPRSTRHTIFFLGGGPASGKSSIAKLGASSGVELPDPGRSVLSNPDECKYDLPEWDDMVARTPAAGSMMHEEASAISKAIIDTALGNGQDVTIDTTGDNSHEKLKQKVDGFRAKNPGIRVVANYATLPTDEAWRRANRRALSPTNTDGSPNRDYNRLVPKSYLNEVHANISRDFVRNAALFDDVKLWSGPGYPGVKGGRPRMIASGGRGKPLVIHDKVLWAEFLSKARVKASDLRDDVVHSAGGAITGARY